MTAQVHASGLRRNPAWVRALTALLVSRLGDLVFDLTVVLWITTDLARGKSWAPAAVSGVLVAAVVPTLVFGPFAGVHSDRHDRRRMMLRANLLQAVFIGSLLVTPVLAGHVSDELVLVWIYVAVFVTNAAGQYFNQGRLALVAVSVPTEERTAAFGMQGVAVNLLSIIGPPLAAPLLFSVGVYPALALNAVSFLLSSAILSRIAWDDTQHAAPGKAGSFWSSLAEGAAAVSSNRVLSTLVVSLTIATFGAGAINVLEVFFVTEVLHVAASVVGILLMGWAAGNVVGGLLAARVERRFGASPTFATSLVLVGVMLACYSRSTTTVLALALMFLCALPMGVLNTVFMPLAMASAPQELLGRSLAALNVFPTVASLVAMGMTGWLASTVLRGLSIQVGPAHFGPVDSVFFAAGLLMTVAGAWAAVRLRRPATTTPAAVPVVGAERA